MKRMSESAAPKLGKISYLVTMDVELPPNASGVLYCAGWHPRRPDMLCERRRAELRVQPVRSLAHQDQVHGQAPDRQGEDRSRIQAGRQSRRPDGHHASRRMAKWWDQGRVPTAISLPLHHDESFDIGSDLNSPVSLDYYDQAPFAFNGTIGTTRSAYSKK